MLMATQSFKVATYFRVGVDDITRLSRKIKRRVYGVKAEVTSAARSISGLGFRLELHFAFGNTNPTQKDETSLMSIQIPEIIVRTALGLWCS